MVFSMNQPLIWGGLFLVVLLVVVLILLRLRVTKQRTQADKALSASLETQKPPDWTIYYASQRGRAKKLALQSAHALELGGMDVAIYALSSIKPQALEGKTKCLFITSTFGSGQAPEHARSFERQLKKSRPNLSAMQCAILALGDKQYDRFCGFGIKLQHWLTDCQSQSLSELVTVNQMNTEAIESWKQFIETLGGNLSAFEIDPINRPS